NSPLREGLSRDEWVERREAWADEAHPDNLTPSFIYERDLQKIPKIWVPNPLIAFRPITHKEIEVGWSIELDETPLSDTLPELPKATVIYEETGRHWFWTSYTLVQEQDEWRIQSISDEGTNAQGLPSEELQKRVQEHNKYLEEFAQTHKAADVAEAAQYLDTILWR